MEKIKALFLSAQPVVLSTLRITFASCPVIFADFDDYSNFNDLLYSKKLEYNVIIFDDGCLKIKGLEIISDFIVNITHIKKILFTGRIDKKYLKYFIHSGIDGILSKEERIETLKEAIFTVMGNKKYYSDLILEYILKDEQNNDKIKILTDREKEVIELLQMGLQNKQIAQKLCLSIKTIENHKQNIKNKLGIVSFKKLIDAIIPL